MIQVERLVKEYRVRKTNGGFKGLFAPDYQTIRAVDDICFSVAPGEMVGYIGPNGAGKSTTLKLLTSILTPTSGEVRIDGRDPQQNRKAFVKQIGAMFGQKTQLWWDLPLEDSFLLLKDIFAVDDKTYRENMALFTEVLELDRFLHQPVRQLSLGQRVRGDLAAVLLHNPKVVFLDEPTLGIDFLAKQRIREFIREAANRLHFTLMLTSHDIADIESLCERIIVINEGRLTYTGTLEALRARYGATRRLHVEFAREYPDFELSGAVLLFSDANKKQFAIPSGSSPAGFIADLSSRYEIVNLNILEPEIETIISEIYKRQEAPRA